MNVHWRIVFGALASGAICVVLAPVCLVKLAQPLIAWNVGAGV